MVATDELWILPGGSEFRREAGARHRPIGTAVTRCGVGGTTVGPRGGSRRAPGAVYREIPVVILDPA